MSEVTDVPIRTEPTTEPVRATALTAVLDGRWAPQREQARRVELRHREPPSHELDTADHRARVTEQLRELGASGLSSTGFAAAGVGDDDIGGGMIMIEMLGYRDLSLMVKAGVQWGLFAGAIQALGTERHHEQLRRAVELELLGCFAMTEAGHGSDVQSLLTTATYDPGTQTFEIHSPSPAARKEYIGNAARDGELAVVFAQLLSGGEDHGVHALLVPIRDADGRPAAGVTIGDCGRKAGLNGVDNGRLSFDHVRVPRGALLDRYGHVAADGTYSSPLESKGRRFFTMLGTLVRGRVSVSGAAQNAAKHALVIASRRALQRRQFAGPDGGEEVLLMDYRAHQRRLLPSLATSYALSFAQNELISTLHDLWTARDAGQPVDDRAQRELEARAAGLKAVSTWHASDTIQACREACGGAGYLAENTLPQLRSDTDVFTTFEGDNTVLLQLVGKGLLTDYSAQFEDLDWRGVARFAAENFVGAAIERTVPRGVFRRLGRGGEGVRDRVWQLGLLEDREKHLVETLASRLRHARSGGADSFTAVNSVQPHLLHAARAHVDRIVLEATLAAIDACEDPAAVGLLELVCDLHVLSGLERDRGWYLEHKRMSDRESKEITRAVDALCVELRPHVSTLVDAFAIPEHWIEAEIAQRVSAH